MLVGVVFVGKCMFLIRVLMVIVSFCLVGMVSSVVLLLMFSCMFLCVCVVCLWRWLIR